MCLVTSLKPTGDVSAVTTLAVLATLTPLAAHPALFILDLEASVIIHEESEAVFPCHSLHLPSLSHSSLTDDI